MLFSPGWLLTGTAVIAIVAIEWSTSGTHGELVCAIYGVLAGLAGLQVGCSPTR